MHHFPKTEDVIEGLRYKGYVGPYEDITEKIIVSVLAAEYMTGISIFRRGVFERTESNLGWVYLSAYNVSDITVHSANVIIGEINLKICGVKIVDKHISRMSWLLNTCDTQTLDVMYYTGYKDGELPALYQELILNLIYFNTLPLEYRNDEIESEINRLVEISQAQRMRFMTNRFAHMSKQGIV